MQFWQFLQIPGSNDDMQVGMKTSRDLNGTPCHKWIGHGEDEDTRVFNP